MLSSSVLFVEAVGGEPAGDGDCASAHNAPSVEFLTENLREGWSTRSVICSRTALELYVPQW
jgi:hypothetical protein